MGCVHHCTRQPSLMLASRTSSPNWATARLGKRAVQAAAVVIARGRPHCYAKIPRVAWRVKTITFMWGVVVVMPLAAPARSRRRSLALQNLMCVRVACACNQHLVWRLGMEAFFSIVSCRIV